MGLQIRGNSIYLYRSVRRAGRVASEYVGSGWLALAMSEEEDERREAESAGREAFRAMREEDKRLDRAFGELARKALSAARTELEANGYHQHCRGQWRKRRGFQMAKTEAGTERDEVVRIGEEEPFDLVNRATGDRFIESWAAALQIRRETKGANRQSRDLVWKDLVAVVEGLAGPDPTPAESLLARAAGADWLSLQFYRAEYETLIRNGTTFAKSGHFQARIDRTHRRMLRSIKTLAMVRRLRRPAATIKVKAAVANIAQQVNGVPAAALEAV